MEKIQLKSEKRDLTKLSPEKLRKSGLLPVVLYGHNIKSTALVVALREFEKTLKKAGESTIINLITDDGKTHPVLIHDVQKHYLTSTPIHADFYEVSMTEKLKAKVVLEFIGEAKAVKELGGVLVKNLSEIEVECLPVDLPHSVAVDIFVLKAFTDAVHIKDLKISAEVHVLTPADEVVAKVQPPRDVEAELAVPVEEKVEEVLAASEKPKTAGAEEEAPAKAGVEASAPPKADGSLPAGQASASGGKKKEKSAPPKAEKKNKDR
jgi:large subunit ribosomal protein L25